MAVAFQHPPQQLAHQIVEAHLDDPEWLDRFGEALDRQRAGRSLARVLATWDLSQSELAGLLGVTRQAVSKWLATGVPGDRATTIADLAAATDLLVRYLQRDRIPAVVRRPAAGLGGRSLVEVLGHDGSGTVLEASRAMFAFEHATA